MGTRARLATGSVCEAAHAADGPVSRRGPVFDVMPEMIIAGSLSHFGTQCAFSM